jgi:hypothetical protein
MTRKKKSKGLGDTIEKITEATGIKSVVKFVFGEDCGCKERQQWLNENYPYNLKIKRCFTEVEFDEYKHFKETRTNKINDDQIKLICRLYADVHGVEYVEPCRNCSPKPFVRMIDSLDAVLESYLTK